MALVFQAMRRRHGGGSVLELQPAGGARYALRAADAAPDAQWIVSHLSLTGASGRFLPDPRLRNHLLAADDGEFDWTCGVDLLDGVSDFPQRLALLQEMCRVARKGVFLTASNRWHPLSDFGRLPCLHWLRPSLWHRLDRDAARRNLHLLGARDLLHLASLLPGQPRVLLGHVRRAGVKSHFHLMIEKSASDVRRT